MSFYFSNIEQTEILYISSISCGYRMWDYALTSNEAICIFCDQIDSHSFLHLLHLWAVIYLCEIKLVSVCHTGLLQFNMRVISKWNFKWEWNSFVIIAVFLSLLPLFPAALSSCASTLPMRTCSSFLSVTSSSWSRRSTTWSTSTGSTLSSLTTRTLWTWSPTNPWTSSPSSMRRASSRRYNTREGVWPSEEHVYD